MYNRKNDIKSTLQNVRVDALRSLGDEVRQLRGDAIGSERGARGGPIRTQCMQRIHPGTTNPTPTSVLTAWPPSESAEDCDELFRILAEGRDHAEC